MGKITVEELLEKFDNYGVYKDSVIIHPINELGYSFIEITTEFRDKLKEALGKRICLILNGVEESDPITQFVFIVLEHSF